ncbi:hypothetical protein AK812_SmicGene14461 [Symbiodinium microadriaticum]|uniref:Uncharacterized protein n=1 Tax=Symbiodinium microadriaticum TaxID=2951 RepID=A0A1Q9E5I0_SYMMI|nr:hypothetical protein AK812_SmicGene14461 [Symbiodinium microadriaticum]
MSGSWAREALSEWAVEPRRTLDYALCIYDRQAAGKAAKAATPTSGREVFYTNRREAVVALSVQWPDETWTKLSAEEEVIQKVADFVCERYSKAALPEIDDRGVVAKFISLNESEQREHVCRWRGDRNMVVTMLYGRFDTCRWAMDTSNWTVAASLAENRVITHAMAGDTKPRMLPLADVQVRNEDMTNLEKLTGIRLSFAMPRALVIFLPKRAGINLTLHGE